MSKSVTPRTLIPWIIAVIILMALIYLLFTMFYQDKSANNDNNRHTSASTLGVADKVTVDNVAKPTQTIDSSTTSTGTSFETGVENLPHSLKGTTVDGEIIIDENNRLVPTKGLRRLYDYFLSALGEETSETIDARVEAYITSRTPEPAASTAIALYHTYKDYLKRLNTMQENYGDLQLRKTKAGEIDLDLMRQRQQDIFKIRKELFTAETIDAFFDSDDELDEYNFAMLEIGKNENLTEKARQQAVEEYRNNLPDSVLKERLDQKQNFQNLIDRTNTLKAEGASAEELFAMRAEIVGAEAAERLAEVDTKNQEFDQRFEKYQRDKAQILSTTPDTSKQAALIKDLESQMFSETEQKRLTGYDAFKKQKLTTDAK